MGATINYTSDAGNLKMILNTHQDIIKAFKTIILMEQNRIDLIKAEEISLQKANELVEAEYKKSSSVAKKTREK